MSAAMEIVAITSDGFFRIEPKAGDFPDADAIKEHVGTKQQPGHRRRETHAIERPFAEAAGMAEPVDGAKSADDHRQGEDTDENVTRADFHYVTILPDFDATAPGRERSPLK